MHALVLVLAPLLTAPLQEEDPLLLTGARVLAESGAAWRDDVDVLVRNGRIERIVSRDEASALTGVRRVDLSGQHLIPGLIDLHSHLLLHPYDETSWNDQVLKESVELRTIRAIPAAKATLEAGFTTLRELGTEGAGWADVALRDAIEAGIVPGPRLFAATRALVATGCYGPAGFAPRIDVPKGAQVADGPVELRRAVREQIASGADWIKVYADYRRKPGDLSTPTFSEEELAAVVHEATSAGVPVAAHASTDEAIRRAIRAGAKTIEHGTHASPETLREMRERGVVLCPTLAASEAISRYSGWTGVGAEPPRVRASRTLIANALDAGVTIACASDVGVFAHGDNARELELLVAYGLTPAAALRSATRTAAEVLGEEEHLGRIAVGFAADLVVVRADPLADIDALRDPALVIARGRVVIDRR